MADEENPLKYFTMTEAAKIAKDMNILHVPHSEFGMRKHLETLPPQLLEDLSQPREGRGGGTEYHWTIFPERLWSTLDAEIQRRMPAPINAFDSSWPETVSEQRQRAVIERTRPAAFWGGGPKERKQRPTFNPPGSLLAQALADAAGLTTVPNFLPFEIRSVDRCLVRYDRKKFFSRDLNPYHKKEACVTATADHPELLWVLVYEKPRNYPAGPGKLICVADANANKKPYFPLEFQRAAEAKRAEGHARRAAAKALEQQKTLEMGIPVQPECEILVFNEEVEKLRT